MVDLYDSIYVRDLVNRQNKSLTEAQKHQIMNVKKYNISDFKDLISMFENGKGDKSILIIRCKNCGHESVTHRNGKVVEDDFICVPNKNPFLREILCPVCKSEELEYDHDKKNCGCIWCSEQRKVNGKK